MAIEELDGLRIVLRQLDLDLDRVRLQEDQPVRRAMLGQRQGPAMEVDDPSGRVVEACELPRAQAVAPAVGVQRVERPAVAEVESAQHAIEEGRDLVRAIVIASRPGTSWAWSRAPRRSRPRNRAAGSRPGNAPSARRRRRPASWPSCRAGRSSSGRRRSSKLLLVLRRRRAVERHHRLEGRHERTSALGALGIRRGLGRGRRDRRRTRTHRGKPPARMRGRASSGQSIRCIWCAWARNKAITRVAAARPRTQARTPRPSIRAAAAIATRGYGQGDDREGDEADRADDPQPGRRGQLIADPDQPLALAVLLLGGHDFQDEPRVAVDGHVPLEPAGVEHPAPAMLVQEGHGPSQDLRAISPRLRPVGHRPRARQRQPLPRAIRWRRIEPGGTLR